jgi:hypothetical protein
LSAAGGIRTRMGLSRGTARIQIWSVYQFRHRRIYLRPAAVLVWTRISGGVILRLDRSNLILALTRYLRQ